MQYSEHLYGMNFKTFFDAIDNMYDEILIYDRNYNIAYINQACCRHYGCRPEQMIGKSFFDFVYDEWWEPSILPVVFREKRSYAIRQKTYMGVELLTIAVPLFDKSGEVAFVVMNVRDQVNEVDLYNPQYISVQQPEEPLTVPVSESPEMQKVMRLVERVAPLEASCIFSGETGVGKTVIAHYLHSLSRRREESFAVFDCTGLPSERMENELFGKDGRAGLLERMRGGTLLLEKISELSLGAQSRLLQHFSQMHAEDSGEKKVRILASTDRNLQALIESGQFRQELYYLLNVAEIYIPPLRKRRQDIRPLAHHFTSYFCSKYGVNRHLTEGAMQVLIHADWSSSNVRELRHTIERLIVMIDSPVIDVNQLPKSLFGIVDLEETPLSSENENFDERVAHFEASLIHDAYQKYGTSRRIAKHLGISQTKANNLIRKYIKPEE